jgi:hypothetical protein
MFINSFRDVTKKWPTDAF